MKKRAKSVEYSKVWNNLNRNTYEKRTFKPAKFPENRLPSSNVDAADDGNNYNSMMMMGPRENTWEHDKLHSYNVGRSEEELTHVFGMEIRAGGLRDWNEELQTAREMPVKTFGERLERAR